MNIKELKHLEHYRYIIENRRFDEYDIIGFLILIREYINTKQNPIFSDIANGIAHRKRNRGKIYDSIYYAILNNYAINRDDHVEGYLGILNDEWKLECANLSKQFNIKITPIISIELAICIFSIIQHSEYETDKHSFNKDIKIKGSIELLINENSLIISTLDSANAINICFMKIENIKILKRDYTTLDVVETYRKNKFLYLKNKDEVVLKVTKRK